jgi:threonylcarbamoyladenosine tRNA methylthiotransferase MtaB
VTAAVVTPNGAAAVITHGCRSNLAERDALAALAPPGATVLNSCAVTAEAVRDARAAARKAARTGPVYVTGCAATLEPARFADIATIIPNARKLDPASWNRPSALPAVTRQSRAFVAIQDGCDHACTFCVTTLARGASRSMPVADVVAHIRALAGQGVAEVILTGIDTTSYGQDLPGTPALGTLVQAILAKVPALPRLRLSSLDAAEADPALLEAFADPRLMPHIHLSLQSGDDLVLKRMKRRHSRAQAVALAERLRAARPDIAIGADLIAGFPTEGEAAHANSRALIADCGLAHAHIFPFSPRPGTAAARMPQVPPAITKARAADLRAVAAEAHDRFAARFVGKPLDVVSEGGQGITPHGLKLRFRAARPRGARLTAVATGFRDGTLAE